MNEVRVARAWDYQKVTKVPVAWAIEWIEAMGIDHTEAKRVTIEADGTVTVDVKEPEYMDGRGTE